MFSLLNFMKRDAFPKIQGNQKFDFHGSKKVFAFYCRLLRSDFWFSILIVLTGLFTRFLSLGLFMLMIKVFLSVVNPKTSTEMINRILLRFSDYQMGSVLMLKLMLGTLVLLILVQYLVSKWNLNLFLARRKAMINYALNSKLNEHEKTHLQLCLDHLPKGYGGVLKCCEILSFYLILFAVIFAISPIGALFTIAIVPFLIALLVIKNRKEIHAINESRLHRKKVTSMDGDLKKVVELSNVQFSYVRVSAINSEFFGGAALVLLMLMFFIYYDANNLNSLTALALVFAIRFAINYAKELSRHVGRILQQRVIIDKITNSSFL